MAPICPSFSVIIPAYNEELGITQTLDDLHLVLRDAQCKYEVVVVNDGSGDRTAELLDSRTDCRIIHHQQNQGYGAALKTGIRSATYPIIAIIDGDGTYPQNAIPHLVSLMDEADMVVGARTGENVTYPFIRKVPKYFLVRFAQWIAKCPIPDLNSGLRVFRKDVAEKFFKILPDTFSFTTTITLSMLTNRYRVRYEPIDYHARLGRSKIKPIRDTARFVQLIVRVGVYFAPLRVFLPIASIFYLCSLVSLMHDIFVEWNLTDTTVILFVFATQVTLFALLADMLDKRV
ncbi:MAG: glycosyltransferase family 2 protein [Cyanobacteria bacterium P01_F01_bin.153]